jgi:hypothetical protein
MGKIVDRGNGNIEVIYGGLESPFQGIDSTKSSGVYLAPDSLCASTNLAVQDGYLSSIFINWRATSRILNPSFGQFFVAGDVAVFYSLSGIAPQYVETSWAFVCISTVAGLVLYEYRNGLVNGHTNVYTLSTYNNSLASGPLVFKTINGIVYITGPGLGAIYQYAPSYSATSTLSLLTNYVGGAFLSELNGRLLCLCCDSIVSGNLTYSPFQMSWSAGAGQYGIWNPLVGGLVTGAGYNNLPDVEDRIVGFLAVGTTGYIIRKQGITEISPLNSGTQPFDFNHMWASKKGIGSIYPYTVCQYGSLGAFVSDTGIYTLGYGGLNTIHGNYWNQISELISGYVNYAANTNVNNFISNIWGTLCPVYVDGDSYVAFFLSVPVPTNPIAITLAIGNVATQNWSTINSSTVTGYPVTEAAPVTPMSSLAFYGSGIDETIPTITIGFAVGSTFLFVSFTIDDTIAESAGNDYPTNPLVYVQFPSEEIMTWKDITVTSIVMFLKFDVSGPFEPGHTLLIQPALDSLSRTDVLYQSITVPVSNSSSQQFRSVQGAQGQLTDKFPQLELTFTFPPLVELALRIYKISMFCVYDPEQMP